MTRPELHALVDIVMDARERTKKDLKIEFDRNAKLWHFGSVREGVLKALFSYDYPTFSDFTQAVKEYIKTLENK